MAAVRKSGLVRRFGTPRFYLVRTVKALGDVPVVVVQVFLGDIVFRHFARFHLGNVGGLSILDSVDNPGFERIPLLDQLFNALGSHVFIVWDLL